MGLYLVVTPDRARFILNILAELYPSLSFSVPAGNEVKDKILVVPAVEGRAIGGVMEAQLREVTRALSCVYDMFEVVMD